RISPSLSKVVCVYFIVKVKKVNGQWSQVQARHSKCNFRQVAYGNSYTQIIHKSTLELRVVEFQPIYSPFLPTERSLLPCLHHHAETYSDNSSHNGCSCWDSKESHLL